MYEIQKVFSEGNILSENFEISITGESKMPLDGSINIGWSRVGGQIGHCRIPLPISYIKDCPIDLKVVVPSVALLQQVFLLRVIIKNNTGQDLDFKMTLEQPSGFLLGGVESAKIELPASGEDTYDFSIFGVEPGTLQLPSVLIKGNDFDRKWEGRILVLP